MRIYWATKLRGFLKHLSGSVEGVEFIAKNQYYEVSSPSAKLKSKLIRSRLFDPMGLFQVISVSGKQCDIYGSFNRFLDADKPYFLYLENPTALYHYALGRIRFPAGKAKFRRCLENANLKYIVCMFDACRTTFETVNMALPDHVRLETIYPVVPANPHATAERIAQKCSDEVLQCLYCAQGKRFYTKGGADVLEAVARLQDAGCRIHLTVVTNLDMLKPETLAFIRGREDMTICDFTFSYEQMEEIYARTAVLLQPSSDDSCPLTVLEAIKGGCAVVGSRLYAIPEMVEDQGNGILMEPKYRIFTRDNLPNPAAWGHARKSRLAGIPSETYVSEIAQSLRTMYEDRHLLLSFARRSLELADTKFNEHKIAAQWTAVWNAMRGDRHDP